MWACACLAKICDVPLLLANHHKGHEVTISTTLCGQPNLFSVQILSGGGAYRMPWRPPRRRKRGMSDIGLILHDERHIALEEYAPHHSARNLDSNPSEVESK